MDLSTEAGEAMTNLFLKSERGAGEGETNAAASDRPECRRHGLIHLSPYNRFPLSAAPVVVWVCEEGLCDVVCRRTGARGHIIFDLTQFLFSVRSRAQLVPW